MQAKYNRENFTAILADKDINVFISSSSFEDRCFVISDLARNINIKKAIFFFNENETEDIIVNAEKLCSLHNNASKIALDSDQPIENLLQISKTIFEVIREIKKPNLLIDITTFTHESLLVLLKIIELNKTSLGSIYIAYIGAAAYSINETNDNEKWLSKGIKTIRTILGYSGFTDPTQKNHLMILFGFESERTKRIIDEYEYEYVSLGFGKIGGSIQDDHHKINCDRHKKLLEEYPNAEAFSFSLVNPFEAKSDILQHLSKNEYKDLNTVIAPLSNKLSAVGACLASIANQNIQLAYAKPLIYNTSGYSTPNNDIYFYNLEF